MKLLIIRKKINQIDTKIIKLLKKRSLLIPKVRRIKTNWSYKIAFTREFNMAKNLATKDFGLYPITYMQRIWRELISATLYIECRLKIHIFNSHSLADETNYGLWELSKDHFGSYSNLITHDQIKDLWQYLVTKQTEAIIFPLESQDKWWLYLIQKPYCHCKINLELPYLTKIKTFTNIHAVCISNNIKDIAEIGFYIVKSANSLSKLDNISILDQTSEYIFLKTKNTQTDLIRQLQLNPTDIYFVGSTPPALK